MRKITCLLLLLCLLPSFALADKTITLTFTGDITLGGEDYLRTAEDSFFAVYEREGAGYFLKNFADFFAEDDLTVVNLEGVLTDNNALYPRDKGKGDDGYWFRGPAAYAKVLSAASVEVASLANNHAFDYGAQGFRDTIAAVEAEGLGWFVTNFKTMRTRVDRLNQLKAMQADGTFDMLPKKEVIKHLGEIEKLEKYLGGVKEMKKLPGALFIVDTRKANVEVSFSSNY